VRVTRRCFGPPESWCRGPNAPTDRAPIFCLVESSRLGGYRAGAHPHFRPPSGVGSVPPTLAVGALSQSLDKGRGRCPSAKRKPASVGNRHASRCFQLVPRWLRRNTHRQTGTVAVLLSCYPPTIGTSAPLARRTVGRRLESARCGEQMPTPSSSGPFGLTARCVATLWLNEDQELSPSQLPTKES